jgi:putative transposase
MTALQGLWTARQKLSAALPSGRPSGLPPRNAAPPPPTPHPGTPARFPRLSKLMDEAEHDVLAYMAFPKEHWSQLHSTNPIERLNREVKRRTNVVAIFPNEDAIVRLVGALMLEQNDEWAVCRRYMSLETLAAMSDDAAVRSKAIPAA